MPEVKVIDVRRVPSVNPQRIGKFDRLVTFTPGPGQTHLIILADETFSEATLKEAMRKELETTGQFVGKTITL
jgi:hypothetical protein